MLYVLANSKTAAETACKVLVQEHRIFSFRLDPSEIYCIQSAVFFREAIRQRADALVLAGKGRILGRPELCQVFASGQQIQDLFPDAPTEERQHYMLFGFKIRFPKRGIPLSGTCA